MLNKSTSRSKYVVQSGVTEYPIGFEFQYNGDDTPQIRVTIGAMVAVENLHFIVSEDLLTIKLIPLEEEASVDPNDYSWMDKWVGAELVIERDIPFVQESDYQLGRISSEQIEKDFDLSVMRDQILAEKIDEHADNVQGEIDALHSRIDFVQEEHLLDMAAVDEAMATKATKTELENAKTVLGEGIQGNADAIQKTRDEFAEADKDLSDMIVETKTELQNSIDNIPDTYTKEELDAKFAEIPDSADTYTKEELDAKFAEIPEAVDAYTKAEVDAKLSSVYKFKGSVANVGELPTDAVVGDTYNVEDTGANYAWDGTKWDKLSDTIDLTDYATKEDLSGYLPLSGGTVSGPLGTEDKLSIGLWKVSVVDNGSVLAISRGAAGRWLNFDYDSGAIYPMTLALSLGNSVTKWTNVFTKKLNNGADLIVPTEGGTLARLEDLEGLGGGDYLPLSGGTLTGALYTLAIFPTTRYSDNGGVANPWFKVYTKALNGGSIGADIAIPTAGGTMARLEDINAIGGDGTTGQVLTKTDTGMAWQDTSGGGGDYLPLSGGTLTGAINIYQENTNYQKRSIFTSIVKPADSAASGNLFEIKQDQSSVYVPAFKVTGNIAPNTDESVDFGNASYHFKNVFTKYINAGRNDGPNYATDLYNITVPVKKGTMALLEDIPESTQLETLPVASSDNLNKIYQYTGETSETYTNGYFYKCTETDGVYSWTQVNVQGGGGSDLPDQTGNAGKVLTTDGVAASWQDPTGGTTITIKEYDE